MVYIWNVHSLITSPTATKNICKSRNWISTFTSQSCFLTLYNNCMSAPAGTFASVWNCECKGSTWANIWLQSWSRRSAVTPGTFSARPCDQSVEPQLQHQRRSTNPPSLFWTLVTVNNITVWALHLSLLTPPAPRWHGATAGKDHSFQCRTCHTKMVTPPDASGANVNSLTVASKPPCHFKSHGTLRQRRGREEVTVRGACGGHTHRHAYKHNSQPHRVEDSITLLLFRANLTN